MRKEFKFKGLFAILITLVLFATSCNQNKNTIILNVEPGTTEVIVGLIADAGSNITITGAW